MKSLSLLLLAAVVCAAASDTSYSLIWKPRPGQKVDYKVSVESDIEGSTVVFGAELAMKVPKVEINGDYTVETSHSHATLTVNGTSVDVPDTSSDKAEIQKFSAKGHLISKSKHDGDDDSDPFSRALSTLMDFHPPETAVKIGDSWTAAIKGDEKTKMPPVSIVYKVGAIEKLGIVSVVRVSFQYDETEGKKPVKAEGAFLIDAADGSLRGLEAIVTNLRFDDSTAAGTTKVKVARR